MKLDCKHALGLSTDSEVGPPLSSMIEAIIKIIHSIKKRHDPESFLGMPVGPVTVVTACFQIEFQLQFPYFEHSVSERTSVFIDERITEKAIFSLFW